LQFVEGPAEQEDLDNPEVFGDSHGKPGPGALESTLDLDHKSEVVQAEHHVVVAAVAVFEAALAAAAL
jgi:hypothetical protein